MKLSKKLTACVRFARWAAEHRIDPYAAAELLALAERVFKAGERECNVPNYSADKLRQRFEAAAAELRFKVRWPGLLPSLVRGKRDIYFPEV